MRLWSLRIYISRYLWTEIPTNVVLIAVTLIASPYPFSSDFYQQLSMG